MKLKIFLKKIFNILSDKNKLYVYLANKNLIPWDNDEKFLKHLFKVRMGYYPNLEKPETFNEKLQWLKLNNRNLKYSKMVDKYEVKKYVSDKIGEKYIIPTLGVWKNFDEIDFNSLPRKFVLKCTHDSGGLIIVKDKFKMNKKAVRKKIEKSLKNNYYRHGREWPYKNVKPRIIAEKYMEDNKTKELKDYKFLCFNGKVKCMFIASNRQNENKEIKTDFFDRKFNHLDFINGHPNSNKKIKKPNTYNKMIKLAEELSKDIPYVRIDFYEVNGKVYFGEITFFNWSGLMPFEPNKWDKILGSWIELPKEKNN